MKLSLIKFNCGCLAVLQDLNGRINWGGDIRLCHSDSRRSGCKFGMENAIIPTTDLDLALSEPLEQYVFTHNY